MGASKTLQGILRQMCEQRGAKFFVPETKYLVDNGAMIALTGELMHKAGQTIAIENSAVRQRYRADEVEIKWRK